jgi:hypothetical protein
MSGNFTVVSNEEAQLFIELKEFYKDICKITANHSVLNDHAVVFASDLGNILSKIDVNWHRTVSNES